MKTIAERIATLEWSIGMATNRRRRAQACGDVVSAQEATDSLAFYRRLVRDLKADQARLNAPQSIAAERR